MLIHRTQVRLSPNGDSGAFLLLRYADKPESIIRLPFLFRAAVSQIVSCFIEDVKAGYKMTAAVRKKDEELTINLKCIIGVLMTDSG